jgi:hypothetical protein
VTLKPFTAAPAHSWMFVHKQHFDCCNSRYNTAKKPQKKPEDPLRYVEQLRIITAQQVRVRLRFAQKQEFQAVRGLKIWAFM